MGMVVVAVLGRQRRCRPCDHDQINLETNQVRRKLRQALIVLLGKPVLDGDVFSLNPSKLAQLLPERVQEDRATRSSACIQETYAEDFPCLLRVDGTAKHKEHGAESKDNNCSLHVFLSMHSSPRHLTSPLSPDHLIRSRQHVRRNRHADLLCGFEIDDELKLRRLLAQAGQRALRL